ncbi:MAG: DUF4406 domain-containing protein [Oscillospiraceae bacterium]
MLIYCCHKFGGDKRNIKRAERLIHDLQVNDLNNTYISPIHAFGYLKYEEIGYDQEINLCKSLLEVCNMIYVLSDVSEGVRREVEHAKKIGISIGYMDCHIGDA